MGPRGFYVSLGLLHEATEIHKYPSHGVWGLVLKSPVGGATTTTNTIFRMWAPGSSLHVSCEFHIHNYYGLCTVMYADIRAPPSGGFFVRFDGSLRRPWAIILPSFVKIALADVEI